MFRYIFFISLFLGLGFVTYKYARTLDVVISGDDLVYFYYPRWANSDLPPYLVVENVNPDNADMVGRHVRAYKSAQNVIETLPFIHPGTNTVLSAFRCKGNFKVSIDMYLDELVDPPPTGNPNCFYFQADACEPAWPTEEQFSKINKILKPHLYKEGSEASGPPATTRI